MSWVDTLSDKSSSSVPKKARILLFSYAFPPMQVQMTPAVFKPMAALSAQGFDIDVVCADDFSPVLAKDCSLTPFIGEYFAQIKRLKPHTHQRFKLPDRLSWQNVPDLMAPLHRCAFQYLMACDLSKYQSIITFSPFHSINAVMYKIKQQRPNLRWIAQFSDPWAGNPLEIRLANKLWNQWYQPRCLSKIDYLLHSSAYSLNLMLKRANTIPSSSVLPHVYSSYLYPKRPKAHNAKITLRYIGVLYGRRSPDTLFMALAQLLARQPALKERLCVELIGQVPAAMLNTKAAQALPAGLIRHIPPVDYVESLALMYDADILLLIEADIQQNLFLASKVADYLGANTPIVGLVPSGSSKDILAELGCEYAHPRAVHDICLALEKTLKNVMSHHPQDWCNHAVRERFSDKIIAENFAHIIQGRAL
ncbi:MAG TPA: hypothetical protein DEO98_03460 [Legionellales bacterium]|nr:hypothetical protein [Legionellales bacterium]|tara:strand:- start:25 stop:1287 length:1263 start_codon:yes stop_codon:yes gene_type:complete